MRKILLAGVATVAMTGVAAASGLEPTLGSSSSSVTGSSAPGKSVVRLDGYVFFAAGVASNTLDKGPAVGGRTAKADAFGFLSTFRIYPSFDAQTAGGLRYGAFAEIRSRDNSSGVGNAGGFGGGVGETGGETGGGGCGRDDGSGDGNGAVVRGNSCSAGRSSGECGASGCSRGARSPTGGAAALARFGIGNGIACNGRQTGGSG